MHVGIAFESKTRIRGTNQTESMHSMLQSIHDALEFAATLQASASQTKRQAIPMSILPFRGQGQTGNAVSLHQFLLVSRVNENYLFWNFAENTLHYMLSQPIIRVRPKTLDSIANIVTTVSGCWKS